MLFHILLQAYCLPFSDDTVEEYQLVCQIFVDATHEHKPQLHKKQKIHMLLHLVECMREIGPCSEFNTEKDQFII